MTNILLSYANRKEQIDDEIRRALHGLGLRGWRRRELVDAMQVLAIIGGCAERDRTLDILRREHRVNPSVATRISVKIVSVPIEAVWTLADEKE
jgi:hypothetical protein